MIANYSLFQQARPVDLTVFTGQWPFRYSNRTDRAGLAAMADRLGLSCQCVSHIASLFGHDTWTGNKALIQELEGDSRLLPFVILNPTEPTWDRELEWARQAGAKGVRLTPGYHGYNLRQPVVRELVLAVRETGLPLALSARLQDERLQHQRYQIPFTPPYEAAELAEALQGHPLVVSGYRLYEYAEAARYFADNQTPDNVLFDLWYVNGPLAVIASIVEKGLGSRFAYGSCHPVQTAEATALQLAAADISEEARALLCRGNALRYLGMQE